MTTPRSEKPLTTEEEAALRRDGNLWYKRETIARLLATLDTARSEHPDLRAAVVAALTSEDEIAHGEAWTEERGGLGECAYCDQPWPCRTQRGIDRLLAALAESVR